jgi:hypothetical protein
MLPFSFDTKFHLVLVYRIIHLDAKMQKLDMKTRPLKLPNGSF